MYQLRCGTCEQVELFDVLESAQRAFAEHAERQHEVVIQRIDGPAGDEISAAGGSTASNTDTEATVNEE